MAAMKLSSRRMAAAALLVFAGMGLAARGQGRAGVPPPVTYDNKYELYGGLNYMNFKAGENLPKRMNLGGAEIEALVADAAGWASRRTIAAARAPRRCSRTQASTASTGRWST